MPIKSIEFGFFSPKMIKEMAAIKIEKAELYDPDGYPIDGGLSDLHLGVVDPGLRCRTCGGKIGQCLGHFGYLELTKPVIHPLFGKRIYIILKATCQKCSKPLADYEEIKKMKNPLLELYKKAKQTCPHCGEKQKVITFQKPTTYREGKSELNAEQIRQRLEAISDDDVKLLKINGGRPEWFVLTILPIPPVTVRPSITLETGERSEDDLTHKLVDVVRINERLRKNLELGAPDFIIADIWELLQYHISTFMNNEISTLPPARHRSGRALKTLIQRLSKKDGRFRGNLSGKRVNFSARTVISPDPMISINEVGVPDVIAKELTVPIKVNKNNIKRMREFVLNGPNKYPGANYVVRPDGVRKKIIEENKEEISKEIDVDFIVERHLIDGDITIFNRQPSLHRMSMMAHKVKVMPYRTFRLNLCVTVPYNADFDGDEMNLHVPQTEEAQTEAEMLMLVENHIRSPRYGAPIISCKHDYITGCYLMTKHDTKISKKDAVELLSKIDIALDEIDFKESYTGKEFISLLFPKDLNIKYRSSTCVGCKKCKMEGCEHDSYVVIKNGKLISGVIDDNSLGEKKAKLIDRILRQYGCTETRKFIDRLSKIAIEFLTRYGFSISIDDVTTSERADKKIREIIEESEKEIDRVIKRYYENKLEKIPGLTLDETVENIIQQISGDMINRCGEVIKGDLPFNSAVTMARTGARGSFVNLTQTCGLVGQETLDGKRIARGFIGRTLPHFKVGDIGLKARGFVDHGYRRGLQPFEFFYDATNSRENLMDKSLHTRHSGYMERRLINALQDLKVEYDGTVRDNRGVIIQFTVGEDGIDPAKSDGGKVNLDVLFE